MRLSPFSLSATKMPSDTSGTPRARTSCARSRQHARRWSATRPLRVKLFMRHYTSWNGDIWNGGNWNGGNGHGGGGGWHHGGHGGGWVVGPAIDLGVGLGLLGGALATAPYYGGYDYGYDYPPYAGTPAPTVWYWCDPYQGYYPAVPECPVPWRQVVQ